MALRKIQKILLIAGVALVVVQVPWYFAVQAYVNKTQNRTTATVVKIVSMDAGCTGDWIGRPDPTCDHSPREYPVYEYYDDRGQKHQQDDRFLGEYKQNNPIRGLFWKDVGDSVTAYYTKDKPEEVVFMAGPFAYAAWFIPLHLAVPILIVGGVIAMINKRKHHSGDTIQA